MPVSPQCAGAYIINLIAFWLLLLLHPATVSTLSLKNCSFIDGHILEFVCHGKYERQIRLQYKDRNPAINAPYSIWQRADYFGSSMLLIVFYEGPLTRCYNIVYSDGLFYCNGRNYPMELDESIIVNCIPFQFTYADELHKRCKTSKKTQYASTISSVIIYMESNIQPGSGATKCLYCSNLLVIVILLLRF
ncbi:PREDICTED: uncharacterized protein LOC108612702 [Drosophila arizonae]|uniref:Uncharacterized protein LOC108612702 n=1 Tax=Drosophila arizonae TaxID=7263 RepID=A0ABM1P1R3_DROAR|nr:PREDICTED: uncharacterized protein LOC108612702 [Drosophila arizonae]